MPPKPSNFGMYAKMLVGGAVFLIGGPALIWYVSPTEEQLFLKYNPELQRRSLASRAAKEEDFEQFVNKLKEYSKTDRNIWEAAAEDELRKRDLKKQQQVKLPEK